MITAMRAKDDWSIDNPTRRPGEFARLLDGLVSRRSVLCGGAGALGLLLLGGRMAFGKGPALLGFEAIEPSGRDFVRVPDGYEARVLFAWGDPVSDGPEWRADAGNPSRDQERQAGMHHDGMAFFALPGRDDTAQRGLLAVNHEYTDEGLLHADGTAGWSAEKVRKSQAAHGVSIIEIALGADGWQVVRPSRYARRVTAYTPIELAGPAAGDALVRTNADPEGRTVLGTINNCASGQTPWGTYLTCEENFHGYFRAAGERTDGQKRYGIGSGYRGWHLHDRRFDASHEPNEAHRFGWVVEIDPFDPDAKPKKRTALGRFRHENAAVTLGRDGRAVVYMGDDARFEYIYKFVSKRAYEPGNPDANRDLLDEGTLYAARFHAPDRGEWVELSLANPALRERFENEADLLVHARVAADLAGATPMDRPEWIAIHPRSSECYVTLTNNSARGVPGKPGPDGANPRHHNVYGHILRWNETDGDASSTTFRWSVFLLGGQPGHADPDRRGSIDPEDAFGAPDGLWFDPRGVLWVQTDVSSGKIGKGPYKKLGNNQMLAVDPATGDVRRFLTGPNRCEITGLAQSPDGRTLFVNIQHPGEPDSGASDPANPAEHSVWPNGVSVGRPRSATVAIVRKDGDVIGA